MKDTIYRQDAIDAHCEICVDRGRCNSDICPDMEVFQLLPPAQPSSSCAHENDQDLQPTCNHLATDAVSRQDAIDAINSHFGFNIEEEYGSAVQEVINGLPSAQPDLSSYSDKLWHNAYERGKAEAEAELIRCKDCKWKQGAECVRFADVRPWPDDFCSRAERREE